MASVKILLYKSKKNAEGKYAIALRIIKDRIPKYMYLEYIEEKYWNHNKSQVKKTHLSHQRINTLIDSKNVEAKNIILDLDTRNKVYTSVHVIERLKGRRLNTTVFSFFQEHVDDLERMKKLNSLASYQATLNHLKKFLLNKDCYFEDLNISCLKRFSVYLKAMEKKQNTVAGTLSRIRRIYNMAIEENIVDPKHYPFGKKKIKIIREKTMKIGLNIEEIKQIEDLKLKEFSSCWNVRNMFLFSFYLAGVRISDVFTLKWNNIREGRLYYKMEKNRKVDSLKLPSKAITIINFYKKEGERFNPNDFIFPELQLAYEKDKKLLAKKMANSRRKCNYHLRKIATMCKIDKDITNHISRHSFGNISGSKIPIRMLQKLYRHSNVETTMGYQSNFDHSQTDKALNDVLDF